MADAKVFFGYPSYPSGLGDTMRTAAQKLGATGTVSVQTWEDLRVGGRIIIDEITSAIDDCTLACFDVTGLNANVMFELGYAVGRDKRVWPLLDESDANAKSNWDRLRLLKTIGYVPYVGSDDIRTAFLRDSPHLADETLFQSAVGPALEPATAKAAVFYAKSRHRTDASTALTRTIDREARLAGPVITADPSEASVYPLTWYAQQIYGASVTVIHLSANRQVDAAIHNARLSLVAGLARGMGRLVLLLAEEDYLAPVDYQELVYVYPTAKALEEHVTAWLAAHEIRPEAKSGDRRAAALELRTELQSIGFGEPVAENEANELAHYFVETASYLEVLTRKTTVFVGRKGAGKSANFLRAADKLSTDPENVLCVIRPSGYELEGVVRLLSTFSIGDEKSYLIEALWQYLLLTEIARAAAQRLRQKPVGPEPDTAEWRLLEYVDDPKNGINQEFAIRLERIVADFGDVDGGLSIEETRQTIAQSLHQGALQDLRRLLGEALKSTKRVCVLIDNLDKAWDRHADLDQLALLLVGLLSAIQRIDASFQRNDAWRNPVEVTLAAFLRSDIFDKVVAAAREPDKIPISRLVWTDQRLLLRVIEERYLANHEDSDPGELWSKWFVPDVDGKPVPEYVLSRILPRPRDIVQFCSFALSAAINARHHRVEVEDLREAENLYSQFAFEALLVENGLTVEQLESVVYEFAGGPPRFAPEWFDDAVERAGLPEGLAQAVRTRLEQLSFLGIETKADFFSYAEDARDETKIAALSRNVGDLLGRPARMEIHPAYRAYLEIADDGPEFSGWGTDPPT